MTFSLTFSLTFNKANKMHISSTRCISRVIIIIQQNSATTRNPKHISTPFGDG